MVHMAAKRQGQAQAEAASTALYEPERVDGLDELVQAIRSTKSPDELVRFLRDLCTVAELEAMSHRWNIARLLEEKVPYLEIADRVGTSTATVTRVAHWVRHGTGGYRAALERTAR